jgi:hypothetical protein
MRVCVRRSPPHNSSVRQRLHADSSEHEHISTAAPAAGPPGRAEQKICVLVAAENRLLREALSRMLAKDEKIEIIDAKATAPTHANGSSATEPVVLLLSSRGSIEADLLAIQHARAERPPCESSSWE